MKKIVITLLGLLHIVLQVQAETVTHNGYTYETVVSPYTGRIWLDRNLGASRVCTAIDDEQCFGDYYQWGRGADGHEKKNSNISTTQLDISYWDNHYAYTNSSNFITPDGSNETYMSKYDWADYDYYGDEARLWFWSTTDGQGICPSGFRVPNKSELQAETIHHIKSTLNGGAVYSETENAITSFNDFLKIPAAGIRKENGELVGIGQTTYLYTNSVLTLRGENAWYYYANTSNSRIDYYNNYKAQGLPVRCISNSQAQFPIANAGEEQTIYADQNITLSASKSSDSDGEIVSYEWSENGLLISRDENITLTNLDIGTHIYTLTVTDNDGLSSEDNVTVIVKDAPPLWLTSGLAENYDVVSNEKFYREFEVYANEYYTKQVAYPISTYSIKNLQITTNIESLKVECKDWSYLSRPQLECKIIGNIDNSSNVILTLYDEKYNKTNNINFNINTTSQKIANINDQESFLIITNSIATHTPKISFDILGNNISQSPKCSYTDIDGNIHPLSIKKISDVRYLCDSSRLIDATTAQNDLNNSDFTIKISHEDVSKEVLVKTYIRDEQHANAILQYACEYSYMDSSYSPEAYINGRLVYSNSHFPYEDISDDCKATMFYLGGDVTESSQNKDTVTLKRGIWKLYIDKHVLLIDTLSSKVTFDVDGGELLENEKLLKFQTDPQSKFTVFLKRAKRDFLNFVEFVKNIDGAIDRFNNPVVELCDTEAAVRGTTLKIIVDVNNSIKYNLIEGIVDIHSNITDQNVTLTNMTSFDAETNKVETIAQNTLTPLEVQFLKDTKLNDIDINKSIGSVSIQTDTNDTQYLLLGLNTRYGVGEETIFNEVAEGNYTIRFLNKLWYKKPDDINITIDKDHLEHNISSHYQKIADVYLDNVLQNQAIKLNLSNINLEVSQLEDEYILEQISIDDINTSLLFNSINTLVKIDSNIGTITTDLKLTKEVKVTIMQDGKMKLQANDLIVPESLPAGTQSKVTDQSIKFIVPLDEPIKF